MKSAEFTDAVVDVHHEVAHLQRHELLDGQGLLVLPEAFLQSEAVVALKQLVVGVDQNLELLVHEPFAQLHRNGLVRHRLFAFFQAVVEDVVQAFQLGGLSAHHDVDVPVFVVGSQVGRDQVKLLVEGRLGGHPVFQDHAVGPRRAPAKFHHSEGVDQSFQTVACEEQFVWRGALHFSTQPVVVGARPFHGFVEAGLAALGVGHPQDGVGRKETEERFVGLMEPRVSDVGHDGGARHFGHAQLGGGVKLPNGLDLVAKKLQAVRVVEAEGKDVDDAATHAVLAGLVNEVHLFKFVRQQHLVEKIHGVGFPDGDGEGLVAEFFAGDDLLGQGFGKRDDAQPVASSIDFVQHLGAHRHVGVFHGLLLRVRDTGGPRVKEHGSGIFQHRLQVVHEVGGLLFVVQHKHVVSRVVPFLLMAEESRHAQGHSRPHSAVHFHLCPGCRKGTAQRPVSGVPHVELKEVCRPHERQS